MPVLIDKIDLKQFSVMIQNFKKDFESFNTEQKYQTATKLLDISSETSDALDNMREKWDSAIEDSGIDYGDFPPSVLDYLDKQLVVGKIKSAQDIIDIFETGELKDLVDSNDKINEKALKAFEKKHAKKTEDKPIAPSDDVEDVF